MHTRHDHPSPAFDRLTQYGALAFLALALLLLASQIALAAAGVALISIALTAITLLALLPGALWLTTATPPVEIDADGLTVAPLIWPRQRIVWTAVRAVMAYPLLPEPQSERVRQALVGRRKYRPAQGLLLLIPSLPWYYRFTGFFSGQGFTPAIALTNRTHRDYDALIDSVRAHTSEV